MNRKNPARHILREGLLQSPTCARGQAAATAVSCRLDSDWSDFLETPGCQYEASVYCGGKTVMKVASEEEDEGRCRILALRTGLDLKGGVKTTLYKGLGFMLDFLAWFCLGLDGLWIVVVWKANDQSSEMFIETYVAEKRCCRLIERNYFSVLL